MFAQCTQFLPISALRFSNHFCWCLSLYRYSLCHKFHFMIFIYRNGILVSTLLSTMVKWATRVNHRNYSIQLFIIFFLFLWRFCWGCCCCCCCCTDWNSVISIWYVVAVSSLSFPFHISSLSFYEHSMANLEFRSHTVSLSLSRSI